ncbi:MAG: GNAT family N-acetyltransferase [Balneolaceae bacterium]|nr:GNAT family N-acetyltransferase [Balneolaceae bacterium]MCH8549037.1 GNAT family N-acetyltransferase [Balneolaceae bacterium]
MKKLEIVAADLNNPNHAEAILEATDQYARDPMGQKKPLSSDIKSVLIERLKEFPCYIGFIAFFEGKPAGVANCVYSFSTFHASKVINIHDLAVNPTFRGKGIGGALMSAVERRAREEKCHKVTLEVREDNRARSLYERYGFSNGNPRMFFMEKLLEPIPAKK